jgi:hypothetical protein
MVVCGNLAKKINTLASQLGYPPLRLRHTYLCGLRHMTKWATFNTNPVLYMLALGSLRGPSFKTLCLQVRLIVNQTAVLLSAAHSIISCILVLINTINRCLSWAKSTLCHNHLKVRRIFDDWLA